MNPRLNKSLIAMLSLALTASAFTSCGKKDEKAESATGKESGKAVEKSEKSGQSEKGIQKIRKAAEKGDADAQNELGMIYFSGDGVAKDAAEAVGWFKKAAAKDHPAAIVNLAACYENGTGAEKNEEEAFNLFKKAAGLGSAEGAYQLGKCYMEGIFVSRDGKKALEWFDEAASRGSVDAKVELAKILISTGNLYDLQSADVLLLDAAEQGNVEAMYLYSVSGEASYDRSEKEARTSWLEKAAERGHEKAVLELASRHFAQNRPEEGLKLLKRNAESGSRLAGRALWIIYLQGEKGVEPNKEESLKWRRRTAELGDADTAYDVGAIYYQGKDVPQDKTEAGKWFDKAVKLSEDKPKTMYKIALVYEGGDLVEAIRLYEAAAKEGDPDAKKKLEDIQFEDIPELIEDAAKDDAKAAYKLGTCYERGRGVSENRKEAAGWFEKAAEFGSADAMYKLGEGYESGTGVGKDIVEAVKWYQKAADGNNSNAKRKYDALSKQGVVELVEAVKKGDAKAAFELAKCYAQGKGSINQDEKEAGKWFEKAAELGGADMMYEIGTYYYPQDDQYHSNQTEAVKWFEKAAEAGNPEAMYRLGDCYLQGEGVKEKDSKEAVKWFEKAADIGGTKMMRSIAKSYNKVFATEKMLDWYRKAARLGDADAMKELGDLYYENGSGVSKDIVESVKWYKKAAEKGNEAAERTLASMGEIADYAEAIDNDDVDAMIKMAHSLFDRTGFLRNENEALNWLKKAADKGSVDAMLELGEYYMEEYYKSQNSDYRSRREADDWFKKAAEVGGDEMKCRIGLFFYKKADDRVYERTNGLFRESCLGEAVKWLEGPAENGNADADAMYILVKCLRGSNLKSSREKEFKWTRKAAEQGNADAMYELGDLYESGNGVEKDIAEAGKWYRTAAEKGNACAMRGLGDLYESGKGVKKDIAEAMKWYEKAAKEYEKAAAKGDADAMCSLGNLYLNHIKGSGDDGMNIIEAAKWYKKAAEKGNEYARTMSSRIEIIADYAENAAKGDARAMFELGYLYESGNVVNKDIAEAMKWYEKAAGKGNAEAKKRLEKAAGKGNAEAKKRLEELEPAAGAAGTTKKADADAKKNEPAAGAAGTTKKADADEKKEQELTEDEIDAVIELAESGDADAMLTLACLLEEIDEVESWKWLNKSGEAGNVEAMILLYVGCHAGLHGEKDETKALEWIKKAAEAGNPDAMFMIADLYIQGKGMKKDEAEAVKWFRKSADGGNIGAMASIGFLFETGDLLPKNETEAVKWYRMAVTSEPPVVYDIDFLESFSKAMNRGRDEALSRLEALAKQGGSQAVKQAAKKALDEANRKK